MEGAADPKERNTLEAALKTKGIQRALAKVIVFPVIMLACFLILIFYFRAKGGYRPVVLEKS
ncbi:hypothetical protein [Arenibacter sp. S6351L]|uniref:hypothetical protein n=1 Tax=Arenibacter sp. S6351L TaxID=2926407 RepID=UPI001FF6703B|nr:hypothetical protein [Arenibacter sp. S6351L]MCK0134904.1 hypothetical protein [Arenibacter sp. S6351L]